MLDVMLVTLGALLAPASVTTQPAAEPGLACFENLQTPEYPMAALKEHVDGSVWTKTMVSSTGTIEKIDTDIASAWSNGGKLLTPPVEKAIRSAKIKPDCDGKTISVVFRYQLHGTATAHPKVTSHTEPPNLMWIESEPASKG